MVAILKINIVFYDVCIELNIIKIKNKYVVKQIYKDDSIIGQSEQQESTYTIISKKTMVQIIKKNIKTFIVGSPIKFIEFELNNGNFCMVYEEHEFDDNDFDTYYEKSQKIIEEYIDMIDDIQNDENELKKILIVHTQNKITNLPPEICENIVKHI